MILRQLEPQIPRATSKYHPISKIPRYQHRIKDPQTQGKILKMVRQLTGERPYLTSKTTIRQDQEYLVETRIFTKTIGLVQKRAEILRQEPGAAQRRR